MEEMCTRKYPLAPGRGGRHNTELVARDARREAERPGRNLKILLDIPKDGGYYEFSPLDAAPPRERAGTLKTGY